MHNQEVPWIWLRSHDVADADCYVPEEQVDPEEDVAQQRLVLVQHDLWTEHGKKHSPKTWRGSFTDHADMCPVRIGVENVGEQSIPTYSV